MLFGDAGEDFSMDEGMKIRPARKRGRPRKSETLLQQVLPKEDEVEAFTSPNVGKRKMVEAVLESDTVKRPCHGRNGTDHCCSFTFGHTHHL